jgi:pimeloyl-ACP methyl ester carboxylesterase
MITGIMGTDVESGEAQPRNTDTETNHGGVVEDQKNTAYDITGAVIERAKIRNAGVLSAGAQHPTKHDSDEADHSGEAQEAQEGTRPGGSPVWFGPAEAPMRGWIHRPFGGSPSNSRRIVIVPGFGYEELTSGWGLRALAEELASSGHTVLRYDHPGTGDSSGDAASVSRWFDGIHHAVSALNSPDVTLIGVRLGATLALAAAAEFSSRQSHQSNLHRSSLEGELVVGKPFANGAITQIIAVSPIVSGRRMMRELTMLAAAKKAGAAQSPIRLAGWKGRSGGTRSEAEMGPASKKESPIRLAGWKGRSGGTRSEAEMGPASKKESFGDFEAGPLQSSWAAPTTTTRSTPSNLSSSGPESTPLVVGGFTYSSELRTGLTTLDLLGLPASPSPRVEIVHASERATDKNFIEHLRGLGTAVYESHVEGLAKWLDTSSELAPAPQALIALLRDQLHGDSMVDAAEFSDQSKSRFISSVTLSVDEKLVRERCFVLGEPSLSAVLTEPTEKPALAAVAVLLLNSGVERNVGPGRAWVSWSRTLAAAGSTVLRLDLSGVGNSGTWPGKPSFHNYGPETFDDVALGIASLRSMGHSKIVIVGLCASAYSALGTAVQPGVVGIVSLSPQFYRCGTPGSMAEAEDTNFNRHRISQLDQKLNLRRKGAAIEELVGKRHQSIAWIDAWMAQGTHVRLVFGPDDRGLRFLHWRTPRSLKRLEKAPTFALHVHPNLDHALHEASARDDVFADLREFINGL